MAATWEEMEGPGLREEWVGGSVPGLALFFSISGIFVSLEMVF